MSKRSKAIRAAKKMKSARRHAVAFIETAAMLQHRVAQELVREGHQPRGGGDFSNVRSAFERYENSADVYDAAHEEDIATGLAFMEAERWGWSGGAARYETVSGRLRVSISDTEVKWVVIGRVTEDGRTFSYAPYMSVVMRGDDVECNVLNWNMVERQVSGAGVSHVVDFIVPIAGAAWMPERLRVAVDAEVEKREEYEALRAAFDAMPPPAREYDEGGNVDFGMLMPEPGA